MKQNGGCLRDTVAYTLICGLCCWTQVLLLLLICTAAAGMTPSTAQIRTAAVCRAVFLLLCGFLISCSRRCAGVTLAGNKHTSSVLTQTPREISAPASASAFAIAQPKPCSTRQFKCRVSHECTPTAAALERVTSANACLIVSDASNESLLACRKTCIVTLEAYHV